jgi:hypothetical protein
VDLGLDALALCAREAGPQALVSLSAPHPSRAASPQSCRAWCRRTHRRPLGVVLVLELEDHAHGAFPHFCWTPRCSAHRSIPSRTGASNKAGAVQFLNSAPDIAPRTGCNSSFWPDAKMQLVRRRSVHGPGYWGSCTARRGGYHATSLILTTRTFRATM